MPLPFLPPTPPPPLVQPLPAPSVLAQPVSSTPEATASVTPPPAVESELLTISSEAANLGTIIEAKPAAGMIQVNPASDAAALPTVESLGKGSDIEEDRRLVVLAPPPWTAPPPQPVTFSEPQSNFPILSQTPSSSSPAIESPPVESSSSSESIPLETTADRQDYDAIRRVFTAVGEVLMHFRQAELKADRVQTDVVRHILVAEGNVTLTRGGQVLKGNRLEYNLVQDRGSFFQTSGVINLPQGSQDFSGNQPGELAPGTIQPFGQLSTGSQQQIQLSDSASELRQLRFEAERLDFDGGRFKAFNLRVTNDPFSPPELELRSPEATFERISPLEDRLTLRRGRLVFDQKVAVPLLRDQVILSRRQRNILPFDIGTDSDFGGFYVGRTFDVFPGDRTSLVITPLFLLQRAIQQDFNLGNGDLYGGTFRFNRELTPTTTLGAYGRLTSLDPNNLANTARANLRLQQQIGDNRLVFQTSYRDRLFNGSLGEQDVKSNLGLVFLSPNFSLGQSGVSVSYQLGAQYVTADTQKVNLSSPASLGRFQGSVNLGWGTPLWQGTTLPPTQTGGLRYTPVPVDQYIYLYTGLQGVATAYTSGDTQNALVGTIGIFGQIGQFSRNFLDYTKFGLSFSQTLNQGISPFLFDRIADSQSLSASILQQIYGPIRAGVQGSINVQNGERFGTNFVVEYSRRTYGVVFQYSPYTKSGSFVLRISGFNWQGNTDPLAAPGVGVVEGGVVRP